MGIRIGIGSLKIGQGSTGVDWSSYWATHSAMGCYPLLAEEPLSTPTIFVDSAATGAANGTSWTNAYTTLANAVTASADGAVIEISGGATGLTYSFANIINKNITIQGSRDTGRDGQVIIDGRLRIQNTGGNIVLKNITHIQSVAGDAPIYSGANSGLLAYDCTFGYYHSNATSTLAGGVLKFYNCTFFDAYNVTSFGYPTFLQAYSAVVDVTFDHCLMSNSGQFRFTFGGSTLTINHVTFLGHDDDITKSAFDCGNSATTTVTVSDSVFFGCQPLTTGASSKAPTVTNVFWHVTPGVTGIGGTVATFDSANKSTPSGAITNIDPKFVTPKNTKLGNIILRFDDNNFEYPAQYAAVLNPEIKISHAVTGNGRYSATRWTAAQIDAMRTFIAGGNEIMSHGSTHSTINVLNALVLRATGTSPTLTIDTTNSGDSTTWSGSLTITINATDYVVDLTAHTIATLQVLLNNRAVGDGTITATRVSGVQDNIYACCLNDVTAQSISANYNVAMTEAAYIQYEITECYQDLQAYINTGKDRNDANEVTGMTVAAPAETYYIRSHAMAQGIGSTAAAAALQADSQIWGAQGAGTSNAGKIYNKGVAFSLYGFPYNTPFPDTIDQDLFAMFACCASEPRIICPLWHGSGMLWNGSIQNMKTLMIAFGLGGQTFSEMLEYIRTDGGWTISEPTAQFTGDRYDYLLQGYYHPQIGSPLVLP
jgi:hypothetical protein